MNNREDEPALTVEQLATGFDAVYAALRQSPTWRRIGRAVYGEYYPEEADPFSTVTRTDLRRIARELAVGPGQTFADLACGAGGPGLWVARETGAALAGVDLSAMAIGQARERAAAWGLSERATFQVGEAAATGLASASLAGVMSVDAFGCSPTSQPLLLKWRFSCTQGALRLHHLGVPHHPTWLASPTGRSPRPVGAGWPGGGGL